MPRTRVEGAARAWLGLQAVVIVALVLGAAFRLSGLDRKVFWEDEILGTVHAMGYTESEIVEASPRLVSAAEVQRYFRTPAVEEHRSVAATVASLAAEDPQHPPVYYVAARIWAQLFGSSAAAMRSLSAAFGLLMLPCTYWLCLELFASTATALCALALMALSPFWVLYAQEAREYTLWTTVLLLAAVAFLRAARSHTAAPWVLYGVLLALGLYVYPLTGLVALGFVLVLLLRARCRVTRPVAACAVATLGAFVSFVPWAFAMLHGHGIERGMSGIMRARLSPQAILFLFARDLRFPFIDLGSFSIGPLRSGEVNAALTLAIVALSGYSLAALVRRYPPATWGFVIAGLCLPTVPLLFVDLFVRGHFVYQARYFIPAFVGVQLAVAALFAATIFGDRSTGPARRAWIAAFALVLTGELASCVVSARAGTWWNKSYERSRSVADVVNRSTRPLVASDYFAPSLLALAYYLEPNVALRLDLRCSQCSGGEGGTRDIWSGRDAGRSVFHLRADDDSSGKPWEWIDPRPFPDGPRALNMYLSL